MSGTVVRVERRTRPGMMPSLVFGTPGTAGVDGVFAEVEVDGNRLELSKLAGEDVWTIDAMFGRGSFPVFANGFGARYLRTRVVVDVDLIAELDRLASEDRESSAARQAFIDEGRWPLAGEVMSA